MVLRQNEDLRDNQACLVGRKKNQQDGQDAPRKASRQDEQDKKNSNSTDCTRIILGCCFDIANELGSGFLESVYKNSLQLSLREKGLKVETEKKFNVLFKGRCVGIFIPDLIVEEMVIIEVKSCDRLIAEHQAQLINYLRVTDTDVGLLVNFGQKKLEYKRVYHPAYPAASPCEAYPAHPVCSHPHSRKAPV